MHVGVFLLLLIAPAANAAVINGSFEDGLTGWTVISDDNYIGTGDRFFFTPVTYAYPQSTVGLSSFFTASTVPDPRGQILQCITEEGYATISWTMPSGVTYSRFGAPYSVIQTVYAQAGAVISGWANYLSDEGAGPGQASVLINGHEVWAASDAQIGRPFTFLGWQHWSYIVPQDGDFAISLHVNSSGNWPWSAAYFDDIELTAVPEQATFMVGAFSILLVGLDAGRRTMKGFASKRVQLRTTKRRV
jgi:hypothetical protein